MNNPRFEELCIRTAELFPNMPLREIFSMVQFNMAKDEFQPENDPYIRNLVFAHIRHRHTNYDKFIGMREKYAQAEDMPFGLRDAAWNLDRMIKSNDLPAENSRGVWGLVVRAWYAAEVQSLYEGWSQG